MGGSWAGNGGEGDEGGGQGIIVGLSLLPLCPPGPGNGLCPPSHGNTSRDSFTMRGRKSDGGGEGEK